MGKLVYDAELNPAGFSRGAQRVASDFTMMERRAAESRAAMESLGKGPLRSMPVLSGGIRSVAGDFGRMGQAAFSAGRQIVGALSGGLAILSKYAAVGGIVSGVLGGIVAKLTVLDSAKFESEVGRAAILSQATPEQREQMLAHARAVGVETPFGPQAVAESMKVEAQRGRSPQEIIALTEATKRFAVIANIDMAQAAETLSQVMFQFDVPMKDATKTALQLSNAVTSTALSGSELFDAMKFAGGAAGQFGVDLSELLAVLGTLRRGLDASTASTGLKNIMLLTTALRSKQPKLLKELGLDEEDAAALSFMGDKAKSLVGIIKDLQGVLAKQPELAIKIFGTRTSLAFLETAGKSEEFYAKLQTRINDVELAQRQYNESIQLADNIYRRLETTAGAVMLSIGSKLREALSLDSGADKISEMLGNLSTAIAAMPKASVQEVLDTLGAGLIQAFGTAVAFLVEALGPVALGFGDLLFRGIVSAAKNILQSDEMRSYVDQYSRMTPEQRAAEKKRLEGSLGVPLDSGAMMMLQGDVNARRGVALQDVIERQTGVDEVLKTALAGLKNAGEHALQGLAVNPSVLAARKAYEAGQKEAQRKKAKEIIDNMPSIGILQSGIVNNYGASSGAARAAPTRPSGSSRAEAAAR